MNIIHTILSHGECLMPQVLEGILNQSVPCCLMPITSTRDWNNHRRKNMIENWRESFHYSDGDIYIGMDSDVVLKDTRAIEVLLERIKNNDIVMIASKTNHQASYHGFFAVRKNNFLEFEEVYDKCPICLALNNAVKSKKKIEFISEDELDIEECIRLYIRRKEWNSN